MTDLLTWEQLTEAEPRLQTLLEEARAVQYTGGRVLCVHFAWNGNKGHLGIKPRLAEMVGSEAAESGNLPSLLRSEKAYEVAHKAIFRELPTCRLCPKCRLSQSDRPAD